MNKAYIIQDIQAGDQAKGSIVDLLSYQISKSNKHQKNTPPPVIRHSGGPQCGHNVEANGKHHCFQMWGSGSFNGSDTYLLQNVLINPMNIERERRKLAETTGIGAGNSDFWHKKMFIHEDCLVITPFHIALNRLQELKNQHGSVGSGCWAAIEFNEKNSIYALRAKDLRGDPLFDDNGLTKKDKLLSIAVLIRDENSKDIENYKKTGYKDEFIDILLMDSAHLLKFCSGLLDFYKNFSKNYQIISDTDIKSRLSKINQTTPLIFEGNQGTLLDPDFGFAPHTTANSSTAKHAIEFCSSIGINANEYHIIGATRPYMTRHGAGPFPSWDCDFYENGGNLPGEKNKYGVWQGDFRVGKFDLELINRSLKYQGIDSLFVSCLDNDPYDTFCDENGWVDDIFDSERNTINKAAEIAEMLNTNLYGFSFGPDRNDKCIKI